MISRQTNDWPAAGSTKDMRRWLVIFNTKSGLKEAKGTHYYNMRKIPSPPPFVTRRRKDGRSGVKMPELEIDFARTEQEAQCADVCWLVHVAGATLIKIAAPRSGIPPSQPNEMGRGREVEWKSNFANLNAYSCMCAISYTRSISAQP